MTDIEQPKHVGNGCIGCSDEGLLDKYFAVHLPLLDRLFGTYHLPKGVWPAGYRLAGGAPC